MLILKSVILREQGKVLGQSNRISSEE